MSADRKGATQSKRINDSIDVCVSWSQVSIWLFILVLGGVCVTSSLGFLYNLGTDWPGTDVPTFEANLMWMLGHLIRAGVTGYSACLLFVYVMEINEVSDPSDVKMEAFMQLHMRTWFRSAVGMAILFVYSIYYAVNVAPNFQ